MKVASSQACVKSEFSFDPTKDPWTVPVLGRDKGLAEGFTTIDKKCYYPMVPNHRGFESMCVCSMDGKETLCLFQCKINANHRGAI